MSSGGAAAASPGRAKVSISSGGGGSRGRGHRGSVENSDEDDNHVGGRGYNYGSSSSSRSRPAPGARLPPVASRENSRERGGESVGNNNRGPPRGGGGATIPSNLRGHGVEDDEQVVRGYEEFQNRAFAKMSKAIESDDTTQLRKLLGEHAALGMEKARDHWGLSMRSWPYYNRDCVDHVMKRLSFAFEKRCAGLVVSDNPVRYNGCSCSIIQLLVVSCCNHDHAPCSNCMSCIVIMIQYNGSHVDN